MSQTQNYQANRLLPLQKNKMLVDKENIPLVPLKPGSLSNQPMKKKSPPNKQLKPLPNETKRKFSDMKHQQPTTFNSPTKKQKTFAVFEDGKTKNKTTQKHRSPTQVVTPVQTTIQTPTSSPPRSDLYDIVDEEVVIEPYKKRINQLEQAVSTLQSDKSYFSVLYNAVSEESNYTIELQKQITTMERTKDVLRKKIQSLAKEKEALLQERESMKEAEKHLREVIQQDANQQISELQFENEVLRQEKNELIKKHTLELKQLEDQLREQFELETIEMRRELSLKQTN